MANQTDLSSMAPLLKPLIQSAMKATSGGDGKTKKKAEVKAKMKMKVGVKRG